MTSTSLGGGGNISLETDTQEGKSPLSEKKFFSVLRQGQDRKPALRRGFASHAEGKGISGNAEQAQGCNAVPSLSSGKNQQW